MTYNLYCISKANSQLESIIKEFAMKAQAFNAQINVIDIFTQSIARAQKLSASKAKESYTKVFTSFIKVNALNIALHPDAKALDSLGFANLLKDTNEVNFFIGGAFGFEEGFLKSVKTLSLSPLTFSHKIAKLVLIEQIYRALSILANHPYHK
ncbi:MAG: 23S rRNA (pseudouridine(1915)-N(3))-methyltransferase RlmH [Helicobacter sp.]|nr:23S rRNA (pseudouridine(1915)-N(3))-methyltransferase RlmH [Helicobacter sp.]MCI7485094.1 23S rRNA (pseudouridine(1915)-N(3))-methyltransferase RlmH [Helicobacter sp.]